MVSDDTLLKYKYCKMTFTVHNYGSDKKLVSVISQNNQLIFFSLEYY